ncbi:MAG: prolyl oligopeptidase family serine peptidase [Bacillota bacterium]|jgi:dipeptidyl aminopeptidase/acylaminoacyl peptidase
MEGKRRLTSDDLYRLVFVSDHQISPDGKSIAYVRTHIDEKTKEYRSNIWMVPCEGGEPRQYTSGPKADTSPRWSPDGTKLAFLSDRNGDKQIFIMPTTGGEARQLTNMRRGAGAPVWSPDSQKVAFTVALDPDDKPEEYEVPLDQKAKETQEKKKKNEPVILSRLRVKADATMGLAPNRFSHVFVKDVQGELPAKKVTCGDFNFSSPAWSPDGTKLAVSCNMREDADWEPWFSDIFVIPSDGGEAKRLTPSKGPSGGACWTPDGKYIVYAGHNMEHGGPTLIKLWKIPAEGGEPVLLTGSFDRSSGDSTATDSRFGGSNGGPTVSPDGKTVYFLSSDEGRTSVWSVPTEGGNVTRIVGGDRHIFGFTIDASGTKMALGVSTPTLPGDIASYCLKSGTEKMLTEVNKPLLDKTFIGSPELIPFKAKDGWQEYGWVLKPVGYQEGKKYPAVLEIHGGPHSMYGYGFFFEFQLLANRGYAVVYTNPRGSQGFGQEFVKAVNGDYGGMDFQDIMTWTDVAISQGYIDEKRVGVTGGSYGGFMTNWIVGHTQRYAAAVTQRSISNWTSFHGVSDIGYTFLERELLYDLWKDTQKVWETSPIAYVDNVTTPILIIHSEQDMRCPIEQGEQFYVALKKRKVDVEMARFPGANHELSRSGRPVLRVARLNQILRWFDGHIKKNPEDYDPGL